MKQQLDRPGFDRAMSDLEARVAAVAAAIVRATAGELEAEVGHQFGGEADVSVEERNGHLAVRVAGAEPVLREFGTRSRPAAPWLRETVARATSRARRKR